MSNEFVVSFQAKHGRPPRVLHVGNIANNAYINAKLLNRSGIDCDVMCSDYYHIMGCPEWEEVDFTGTVDHFRPDWTRVDLKGYARPPWFAQGPREMCMDYLVARRSGQTRRAARLWRDLGWANKTQSAEGRSGQPLSKLRSRLERGWSRLATLTWRAGNRPDAYRLAWAKLDAWASRLGESGYIAAALVAAPVMLGVATLRLVALFSGSSTLGVESGSWRQVWPERFRVAFPERQDQLSADDVAPYHWAIPSWKRLFSHYDIVQAYATDVVWPMLAHKHPYIGFEHGTLRVFTLNDDSLSRLTALGYRLADHVLITNGDCLEYAHKIGVISYTAMIHPFDDEFMRAIPADREGLRARYGAARVFLCPLRHDWEIKGTDKYIRALPAIAQRIGRDFKVVMTRWGGQVDQAERLAERLGVADLIAWVEPLNRVQLVRHLKSVDVVFDQIALPCFGGTAPQAIATGQPVIMSYDSRSTEWLIPDPAPILTAWSVEQIVESVMTALDPAWRLQFQQAARRWYETHHSAEQVVAKQTAAYLHACRVSGLLPPAMAEA